jgi:hypothetical protein
MDSKLNYRVIKGRTLISIRQIHAAHVLRVENKCHCVSQIASVIKFTAAAKTTTE